MVGYILIIFNSELESIFLNYIEGTYSDTYEDKFARYEGNSASIRT